MKLLVYFFEIPQDPLRRLLPERAPMHHQNVAELATVWTSPFRLVEKVIRLVPAQVERGIVNAEVVFEIHERPVPVMHDVTVALV